MRWCPVGYKCVVMDCKGLGKYVTNELETTIDCYIAMFGSDADVLIYRRCRTSQYPRREF